MGCNTAPGLPCLGMQSGRPFLRWRRDPDNQHLTINSWVVLLIDRLGSFPGEVRWQDESFAGIQFLQDPAAVEERLRRARLGAVCRARPEQLCGPQRARQHETRRLA